MRVLAIVHGDHAAPGVFGDVIREAGHGLDEWMGPAMGEQPADPLGYHPVLALDSVA